MPQTYHLQIITQQGVQFDDEVWSMRAPAADGYLGVRAGHAPMIADLREGVILVRFSQWEDVAFDCYGGILQVEFDQVTILADDISERTDTAIQA